MPRRAGITTRPDALKKEWLAEYPEMRHWELVGPFATYREAEDWDKRQHGGLVRSLRPEQGLRA